MFQYILKILPQSIQNKKRYHNLVHFTINSLIVIALWAIFFGFFRHQPFVHSFYELAIEWLTNSFLVCVKWFLELFGYEPVINGKIITMPGIPGIMLDRGCLGRNLMGLFTGFLLVYPGNNISKIWFIPFGLLIIYFLNVLRIAALLLTEVFWPEYMDINHHLVFKVVVYSLIFLMWYWWIRKYGK
jgi:exosortase/archaeosortase family protein